MRHLNGELLGKMVTIFSQVFSASSNLYGEVKIAFTFWQKMFPGELQLVDSISRPLRHFSQNGHLLTDFLGELQLDRRNELVKTVFSSPVVTIFFPPSLVQLWLTHITLERLYSNRNSMFLITDFF